MDSSLPVDIKLSSLLEWLQSRRHIKQDWAQKVKEIRAKIAAAIQDMPESEEIKNLLSNTYINYYHCVKIVEILKETEKDTQNFFGYYSSQRMKDWQAIISLYQKDRVYVAEAAHYLNQLVKYDIPALKRDLNAMEKKISEKEDKEKTHQRMVGESARIYKEELARRELKGENLRAELIHKTKFIPQHANEIGQLVAGLTAATELYLAARKDAIGSSDDVLPLLRFIQARGPSTTAFEFKHGVAPSAIERPDYEHLCQVTATEEDEEEIDFGDLDDGGEIDFGISTEDGGEIDFGDEGEVTVAVISDQNGVSSGVAVGDEALTLLENKYTRNLCKLELLELLAFLKALSADEAREHPADMLLTGYSTKSEGSPKDLRAWMDAIQSILADFSNPDKAMLFEIFHSPNSMAALVEQLEAMKAKIGFHEKSALLVHKDEAELRDAFAKRIVDVKAVVANAKLLESQLGKDMGQFTQGRPVNFMGGAKTVDALFSAYSL